MYIFSMYICIYVYIYICVYICICVYIYRCMYVVLFEVLMIVGLLVAWLGGRVVSRYRAVISILKSCGKIEFDV